MFDLYKGATRPAMMFGIPTDALIYAFCGVGLLALSTTIAMWVFLPIIGFVMRMIAKRDDRAFRQWGLYIDTKFRCPKPVKQFFGATSYSNTKIKTKYQSWDSKEFKV